VPAGCRYQPGEENKLPPQVVTLTAPGPTGAFPIGTYRYTLTVQDILARGGASRQDAANNAGVWTWTMGRGVFDLTLKTSEPEAEPVYPCKGYYAVHDDVVSFTRTLNQPQGQCVPPTWAARFSRSGARISWSAITAQGFGVVFGQKPREKIG